MIQLLKKCNLIDFETLCYELVADPKSKLIFPGYRRGKDVVNGYTIIINGVKWRLIRGTFIVQSDGFNCGPIACLKVMQLFSHIDTATAVDCYGKARIRKVVFEEWDNMVRISDKYGSQTVKDTRRELPVDSEKDKAELSRGEPHLDNDASSHLSEFSSYQSSFDVECIEEDNENGLFFRPDCSSLCMTMQHKNTTSCHLGHKRVLHARVTHVGRYVLFPSMCYHRGYYNTNTEVKKTFLTAQHFASFGQSSSSCSSRAKWNNRSDFYHDQQLLPEQLSELRDDLHAYWDDHYPASRFPPSRMYKNAKIDTQSNRVIHRQDFDRLQHVCNLVLLFEGIYPELHIETVWIIKKSCRGDGFQWWHQDLNANGQVVATIVLNIDSIPTDW